jgi:hypothetical protein
MRCLAFKIGLLALLGCTSGESDLFPFTIRLTPEGEDTIVLTGSRIEYNFEKCGSLTGTCSSASIYFYPSSNGGFAGTPYLIWSATDIPVSNGNLIPGTYQFNDVSTFDIHPRFQTGNGEWRPETNGTLTVEASTSSRLSGHFEFHGVDLSAAAQPPMEVEITFDFAIPN